VLTIAGWGTPPASRLAGASCSASSRARPSSSRSRRPGTSSSSRGSATGRTSSSTTTFNHTFDVALHLGTLLAVGGYFCTTSSRWCAFVRTLATRRLETPDERLAWIVLIATIPRGIVGLALEDRSPTHLGEPWQIAILLAVFAGVLWLVDRRPATREAHELSLKEGLAVGFAQALALAPGVSRSGITISAGRLSDSTGTPPRASRSSCSCRRCSVPSCSRGSRT
jgi:undecaprenyl pyrophosphate phosphatase UppP